jgi:hypothetical protein
MLFPIAISLAIALAPVKSNLKQGLRTPPGQLYSTPLASYDGFKAHLHSEIRTQSFNSFDRSSSAETPLIFHVNTADLQPKQGGSVFEEFEASPCDDQRTPREEVHTQMGFPRDPTRKGQNISNRVRNSHPT